MAKDRINREELADKLVEQVKEADDPIQAMAQLMADFLMESEVAAKVGAAPHERSAERTTYRHGYRPRRWDTRLATLELQAPKARGAAMCRASSSTASGASRR